MTPMARVPQVEGSPNKGLQTFKNLDAKTPMARPPSSSVCYCHAPDALPQISQRAVMIMIRQVDNGWFEYLYMVHCYIKLADQYMKKQQYTITARRFGMCSMLT